MEGSKNAAFAVTICSKLKVVKLVCAPPPQSSSASAILGTASVIVFPRLAKSHERDRDTANSNHDTEMRYEY